MIELLAPGGSKQAIESAANYGADAVYFGIGSFNARASADNLTSEQLPEIVDYLHSRAVKGYLALNILLRDHELQQALALATQAVKAGVDGIIVQDLGLAAMIRSELPVIPVHASTQMTITDEQGLRMASELGLTRVVLPRELNANSISKLTSYAHGLGIETEVFVHGALCIAYSGQCLISGIKRGRSANRGQCSQPCRLSYGISEYHRPYGPDSDCDQPEHFSPIISPKDQALIKYLPDLLAAGVNSLKIEGRMRSADYTAMVVSEYRNAIDQALAGRKEIITDQNKLLIAYNRGGEFTDRYYVGRRDSNFVTGNYPGSFGVQIGSVESVNPRQGWLRIKLLQGVSELPARGDVLSIRTGSSETASAPIGVIERENSSILVKAFHPDVLKRIRQDEQVFQMSDNARLSDIRKNAQRRTPIGLLLETSMTDRIRDGHDTVLTEEDKQAQYQRAKLNLKITEGALAGLETAVTINYIANEKAISEERVKQQLSKTGSTQFVVESVLIDDVDGTGVRLSIADLNSLRRNAIQALEQEMINSFKLTEMSIEYQKQSRKPLGNRPGSEELRIDVQSDKLNNTVSRIDVWYQRLPDDPLEIACGADCYILPLWSLNSNQAKPWIDVLRNKEPDSAIFAWTPPAPQNEIAEWAVEVINSLDDFGIDGICSGHPGAALLAGANIKLQLDSGLNITNRSAARLALRAKPESLAFSSELTAAQLFELVNGLDRELFSSTHLVLPAYGRQRLMSSVYCPVGHNIAGCKKCHLRDNNNQLDNARLYDLCDQKKKRMILQTHPLFCTTDIFDNSLVFDLDMLLLQLPFKTALRLHMLDESYQERLQLVRSMRKFNKELTEYHSANKAELEHLVRRIADRISEGSVDNRRNIYE